MIRKWTFQKTYKLQQFINLYNKNPYNCLAPIKLNLPKQKLQVWKLFQIMWHSNSMIYKKKHKVVTQKIKIYIQFHQALDAFYTK